MSRCQRVNNNNNKLALQNSIKWIHDVWHGCFPTRLLKTNIVIIWVFFPPPKKITKQQDRECDRGKATRVSNNINHSYLPFRCANTWALPLCNTNSPQPESLARSLIHSRHSVAIATGGCVLPFWVTTGRWSFNINSAASPTLHVRLLRVYQQGDGLEETGQAVIRDIHWDIGFAVAAPTVCDCIVTVLTTATTSPTCCYEVSTSDFITFVDENDDNNLQIIILLKEHQTVCYRSICLSKEAAFRLSFSSHNQNVLTDLLLVFHGAQIRFVPSIKFNGRPPHR